jgi:hypothetical protein
MYDLADDAAIANHEAVGAPAGAPAVARELRGLNPPRKPPVRIAAASRRA